MIQREETRMFALFGISGGELVLLLVVGLILLGGIALVAGVSFILYYLMRKTNLDPSAKTPPPVPPEQ